MSSRRAPANPQPERSSGRKLILPDWLKTAGAVIMAILGAMYLYVPSAIITHTKQLSENVATLLADTETLKTDVAGVKGRLDDFFTEAFKQLLDVLKNARNGRAEVIIENLDLAAGLIRTAEKMEAKVDPSVLAEMGRLALDFASVAIVSDTAWNTSNQLLSYRSSLNQSEAPDIGPETEGPTGGWYYSFAFRLTSKPATERDIVSLHGPWVPPAQAARWEPIGDKRNVGAKEGVALILAGTPEGVYTLDGSHLKNVIFKDTTVEYNGGAVVLENVYFVNCKFILPRTPRGRELSVTILAAAATNFKAT